MRKILLGVGLSTWLVVAAAGAFAHEDGDWDKALPEQKRELLHRVMDEVRKHNAPLVTKQHAVYQQMRDILTAPEFDKAQFLARHKELMRLHTAIHDNMSEGFADIAGKLTPQEREIVAQHMDVHWKRPAMKDASESAKP